MNYSLRKIGVTKIFNPTCIKSCMFCHTTHYPTHPFSDLMIRNEFVYSFQSIILICQCLETLSCNPLTN